MNILAIFGTAVLVAFGVVIGASIAGLLVLFVIIFIKNILDNRF